MDAVAGMMLLIFGGFVIFFLFFNSTGKPEDTTAGRWGVKAGKVARGEFGGKKWGDKT